MRALIVLLLLFLCQSLFAANHYILDGGTGDGSAWNNALDSLPTTLVRGDTYYIADGSYATYVFNDAVSGSSVITIKKATIPDHGIETGWQSSYGDGQAVFSGGLAFTTDYWLFDGQTRSSWTNGHGFKILHPTPTGKGITLGGDHIAIQYTEVEGNGPDDDPGTTADDSVYALASQTDLRFSFTYMHNVGRCFFVLRGLNNLIVENSYFTLNESLAEQHAEGVSLYGGDGHCDNNIFRNNIWVDVEGTGVIVVGNGEGNRFYGNLIYFTADYPHSGQTGSYLSNGSITSWSSETQYNAKFFNNTIIIPVNEVDNRNFAVTTQGSGTGNVASNNLYYCSGDLKSEWITYSPGTSHDYSAYSGTSAFGEGHSITGISSSIFANSVNNDYTLATALPGVEVTLETNDDLDGNERGGDGTWDIGAYEYQEPAITNHIRLTFGSTNTPIGFFRFSQPTELVSDSFSRMNRQLGFTDGLGYSDSTLGQGGFWYSVNWGIDSNSATNAPTFENERFALIDTGSASVNTSVSFRRGAAGGTNGLAVCVDGTRLWFTNYLRAYYDGNASIKLDSVVNGNATNLISHSITYADDTTIGVNVNPQRALLLVNGVIVGRAGDLWSGFATNTSHGLWNGNGSSAASFRNFMIFNQ